MASVLGRLRLEHGLTQEALAFKAEVTVTTLRRIELGRSNPTWPTLLKIANALDLSPVELVTAAENARKLPSGGDL